MKNIRSSMIQKNLNQAQGSEWPTVYQLTFLFLIYGVQASFPQPTGQPKEDSDGNRSSISRLENLSLLFNCILYAHSDRFIHAPPSLIFNLLLACHVTHFQSCVHTFKSSQNSSLFALSLFLLFLPLPSNCSNPPK